MRTGCVSWTHATAPQSHHSHHVVKASAHGRRIRPPATRAAPPQDLGGMPSSLDTMAVCNVLQEGSGIRLMRLLPCAILWTTASVSFFFIEQGFVLARANSSPYMICGTASESMRGNKTSKYHEVSRTATLHDSSQCADE